MTEELTMPTGRCPVKTCGCTDAHRHIAKSALSLRIMGAWRNTVPCPIEQPDESS